jgi:putative redox protein
LILEKNKYTKEKNMVPISIAYKGELRCGATHDKSGVQLITDAPADNQGKGESFSPTDLVATALGTCMITTMGIAAQKDGVLLAGTTIAIEKHMTAVPPRKIAKLVATLNMTTGIPKNYRAKTESIGHNCPVIKSLHPDVELDIQFHYPD